MAVTVDNDSAQKALKQAWSDRHAKRRPPARMQQLIEQVLAATDVTFKYILVTGYLAKYVNPSVHTRALQVGSKLSGAYDARSLCHKVVVGFEKTRGNLFGLSNEPFVNKPARHPEHDGGNPQLRNKILAQKLHDALDIANSARAEDVYRGLVHILRVGAQHAADQKVARVKACVNLSAVLEFIDEFLKETDGGSRLVGVWGAIMVLISESGKISVTSPNAADEFGKTAGDVEIFYNETLVVASECKHRTLNLDDVRHGIRKALEKGVPEYHFVIAAGLAAGQEKQIKEELPWQARSRWGYSCAIPPMLSARLVPNHRRCRRGMRTMYGSSCCWQRTPYTIQSSTPAQALGQTFSDYGLVFCHVDGTPLLPDSVSHAWVKLIRRSGLKDIRLHDCRHTHASLMLKGGIHPKIVQERLGHSTIAVTLDTYSHVAPGLQEVAVNRFDDILSTKLEAAN